MAPHCLNSPLDDPVTDSEDKAVFRADKKGAPDAAGLDQLFQGLGADGVIHCCIPRYSPGLKISRVLASMFFDHAPSYRLAFDLDVISPVAFFKGKIKEITVSI